MPQSLSTLAELYRRELLTEIMPFWSTYSIDREMGGYFTCLNAGGKVYDTDKFVWLQARQVWTYAMLYNRVEAKREWLDNALHGARFLEKHGRAKDGDFYFSLTRNGDPLVAPYNIFSDCFAAQAFGQLSKATGESRYAELAVDVFRRILARRDNPKGEWNKAISGTRPLKNFALPMILCNLSLELSNLLEDKLIEELTADCIKEVMDDFYDPESGLILENVTPGGSTLDTFEGRLLNPGHAIEAMWFMLDLAPLLPEAMGGTAGAKQLRLRAKDIILHTLDYAWDRKYGGIFYFMDRKGNPPQQLEWDQKLWWVHLETLIALLKAYRHTGDERCLARFRKVHDYTWQRFRDDENGGEWFGYLNRRGEVLLDLKGGKWKGCYHVPRGLYQIWQELEKIVAVPVK